MKQLFAAAAAAFTLNACDVPGNVQPRQEDWKPGAVAEATSPDGKFARVTDKVPVNETFGEDRSQWGDIKFHVINNQRGKFFYAFNNTYLNIPLDMENYEYFCAKQGPDAANYFLGMERDAAGTNAESTAEFRLVVEEVAQKIEDCTKLPRL